MTVVGTGFLAHHFKEVGAAYPQALILAAGVSHSVGVTGAEFAREEALVQQCIEHSEREALLLVFLSTTHIWGSRAEPACEDDMPNPSSSYGIHKLRMEAAIRASRASWLILRLAHPVGREQNPLQLVPALAAQILSGSVDIWRGARRDIIDVGHAVELLRRVLRSGVRNVIVNIASGVCTGVEQMVDHLCLCLNRDPVRRYIERPDSYCVSIDRLRTIVGDLADFDFDENYWRRVLTRYYTFARQTPGESLRDDVRAASSLLESLRKDMAGRRDDSRILGIVTAASTSESYIPYTVPLVLRQAAEAGLGADILLGLNNGYDCSDVIASYARIPDVEIVRLETGEKTSLGKPGLVYAPGDVTPYCFPTPSTRHRIFAVHQRAGPLSNGKTLMLLDLLAGLLLPNVQRGWVAPALTLLFDAESMFMNRSQDGCFLELLGRARHLLDLTDGDTRAAARALIDENRWAGDTARSTGAGPSANGLVEMLSDFRFGNLDVIGASTRFTAFTRRSRFSGLPVCFPSPHGPISAMHAVYNQICGIVPGCACMSGAGTLARTEVVISLMNVVLSRYPRIYGEDALFTVLAEQLSLRIHLSTRVQVTNRCPALGERSAHADHDAWVGQFAKWYSGFAQIENLYGSEICRSVLGPDEQDVPASGIAIAACRYRAKGDLEEALHILDELAATRPLVTTIREMAQRVAP